MLLILRMRMCKYNIAGLQLTEYELVPHAYKNTHVYMYYLSFKQVTRNSTACAKVSHVSHG